MNAINQYATTATRKIVSNLYYPGYDADNANSSCRDSVTGQPINKQSNNLVLLAKSNWRTCNLAEQRGFACADSFAQYMGADYDSNADGQIDSDALRYVSGESEAAYVQKITVTLRSTIRDANTHFVNGEHQLRLHPVRQHPSHVLRRDPELGRLGLGRGGRRDDRRAGRIRSGTASVTSGWAGRSRSSIRRRRSGGSEQETGQHERGDSGVVEDPAGRSRRSDASSRRAPTRRAPRGVRRLRRRPTHARVQAADRCRPSPSTRRTSAARPPGLPGSTGRAMPPYAMCWWALKSTAVGSRAKPGNLKSGWARSPRAEARFRAVGVHEEGMAQRLARGGDAAGVRERAEQRRRDPEPRGPGAARRPSAGAARRRRPGSGSAPGLDARDRSAGNLEAQAAAADVERALAHLDVRREARAEQPGRGARERRRRPPGSRAASGAGRARRAAAAPRPRSPAGSRG